MKRLYRSKQNKVIAGICGGVGEYWDIDPVIVRILTVILTLISGGLFFLVYIVSVFVIPPEPLYGSNSTTPTEHGSGYEATPQPKPAPNMEEHVRILSILYIVFSALGLIIAAIVFVFLRRRFL